MKVRLLTKADVRQTLGMSRAIELMDAAFRALSSGEIHAPMRTNLANDVGTLLYKPVLWNAAQRFGLKAVSVFPQNAAHNLPVTTGLMLINNGATGLPLALMDAEYLTAIRTGAATGLATRLLARPDVRHAALFGAGGQAPFQLEALLHVANLECVHVFSRQPSRAEAFCRQHAALAGNCRLQPAGSRDVLRDCGIIIAATTSKVPVFADAELAAGTHINGVGSFTPDAAEVPPETVARARVIVDQRGATLAEAGDLFGPIKGGMLSHDFSPAELGEVLLGTRDGRKSPDEITFFKSVGNAAQDIVCAADVLQTAERLGLGQTIEF